MYCTPCACVYHFSYFFAVVVLTTMLNLGSLSNDNGNENATKQDRNVPLELKLRINFACISKIPVKLFLIIPFKE